MLNDEFGAVYFWLIAASMALLTFVWFFCRGWTQHFRIDLRHPYQVQSSHPGAPRDNLEGI